MNDQAECEAYEQFAGRNSVFYINRLEMDAILKLDESSDALSLFVTLASYHGFVKGKKFGLSHSGMKEAGITSLSREKFGKARKGLQSVGLLVISANHSAGRNGRKYSLVRNGQILGDVEKKGPLKPAVKHESFDEGYRADEFVLE